MSRILFDQNVPVGLRKLLTAHDMSLASELGRAQIANGDLIAGAERASFDMLITADRNPQHQRTPVGRRIAIVGLGANHRTTLRDQVECVVPAVDRAGAGSFEEIGFDRSPTWTGRSNRRSGRPPILTRNPRTRP